MKNLLIVVTFSSIQAIAQSNNARPFLIAVQVDDLGHSISWYRHMLGFSLADKKEFPSHGIKIALMKSGDFELELVENRKSANKAEALKKLEVDEITRFAKMAFRVDDVAAKYRELQTKKASFKIVLRDSNINPSERFFIVADPDENWIQFVGMKP